MRLFGLEITRAKEKKLNKFRTIIDLWMQNQEQISPDNIASLIRAYSGWVYVCADRNAKAVAKQNLRLYVAKPKGQESLVPTKALEPRNKLFIEENCDSQIRKAYKDLNTKIVVEEVMSHPFLDLMTNVNPFFNKTDFLYLSHLFS